MKLKLERIEEKDIQKFPLKNIIEEWLAKNSNTEIEKQVELEVKLLEEELLEKIKFAVAQDQDYLNRLCKGRVKIISNVWDKMPISNDTDANDLKLNTQNLKLSQSGYRKRNHFSL